MQFTEKHISNLKSKEKRYDVREKSGNGFGIRVTTSGEKSFMFIYTFAGRKRRMTLGTWPALSLAEARVKHRDALKVLDGGKDPGLIKINERIEARDSSTVEGLIEEFLEKWCKVRKRSWEEDQRILYKDVKPLWGKRKAKDVTKRDVLLLLDRIKERGAPIAANRTLACVRRMFNFAIERDIITASPCVSVKLPSKENRCERCLSEKEIKSFWLGLEKAKMSEGTKLVLKLQLVTAQRKGEITGAEWSEIDLANGWWIIPAQKAKNAIAHRVPLSKSAMGLLKQVKKLSGNSRWLFPSPRHDKTITGASVDHAVRRSDFSDVKDFSPHSLRRTAATHMTSMGISRLVVSKILNHADRSVTAIYDRHSYDKEKQVALESWAAKLEEIIYGVESKTNVVQIQNVI